MIWLKKRFDFSWESSGGGFKERSEVRSIKTGCKHHMLKQTVGESIYITALSCIVVSYNFHFHTCDFISTRVICHASLSLSRMPHYGNHWGTVTSLAPARVLPNLLLIFFSCFLIVFSFFFLHKRLSYCFF